MEESVSSLPTLPASILPMKIYGLDFTSAPRLRKPVTCAIGAVFDARLYLEDLCVFANFTVFEEFLNQSGPWLAGLDFPFGQPKKLIQNLGWPASWEDYMREVVRLGKSGFEQTLAAYRQSRPQGDKQHLRTADIRAKSRSPMMWYGVPVGRMFFEGAPRLLKAGVNVLPCRPNGDTRIVIEAYPALVARRWASSYKNDTKKKQTAVQEMARRAIIAGIRSDQLQEIYGFSVELSDTLAISLIQDPSGDWLDAVLCAIQATWAYRHNFAVPPECDPQEGWIFDPKLL